MESIHIWEFPYNVSVKLRPRFLKEVKLLLKKKYGTQPKAFRSIKPPIPFSVFKDRLKLSYPSFRDLSLILLLCKDLDIPLETLEANISAYRTRKGRITVENPVLPVKITPIFPMLLAHIYGDGNSMKIEGRELYFNYRQYDFIFTSLFIKKVDALFGHLKYPREYFFDLKRVYLPTIVSLLVSNFYGLKSEDFLSKRARIPSQVFQTKSHMLAVLIAFIIDEGNIDSAQIVIQLKNKGLVKDLETICKSLGYNCTLKKEQQEMPCLYILADGVRKFWDDFSKLKQKYPEIGMGYKGEAIERFITRKKKKWRSHPGGSAKNLIIELLNDAPMRVKDITMLISMSRQGVLFHLKELMSKGIVKRKHLGGKKGYVYSLVKYVKVPVSKKGISRQRGETKQKILRLLKKRDSTIKELNEDINIDINTLRNFLYQFEKKGLVKRKGKRIHTVRPWVVWGAS